jgi:RecA-family ATPase
MFYLLAARAKPMPPRIGGGSMTGPATSAAFARRFRNRVSDAHRQELEQGSGIDPEVIAERAYFSIPAHLVEKHLTQAFAASQRRAGLIIPLWDVTGNMVSFQLKPDEPRIVNGKPVKYETAAKRPQCIDVHPRVRPNLTDPGIPLWITEGAKKADAAISHGVACIVSLQGVYGWRGRNATGGKTALTDWEDIALDHRDVILAFDSDCMTKPSVRDALQRLTSFLTRRGAEVRYCLLPPLPDGSKCGLDDFLVRGGTVRDLYDRVVDVLPPLDRDDEEVMPALIRVADVAGERIDWLWRGWLPKKMLTILGGYGGDGKSTVMASLIAALTTGGTLPDGTAAPRTNVLMLSAEDDVAAAIRPRLDAHGADVHRVFVLKGTRVGGGEDRWLDLRRDARVMAAVIAAHDIGLVVIDPLSSYLPKADRNSEGDIRDALQPLLSMIETTGVAVVGIMHVGKATDGRRAAQRLLGSTAFTALARSVLMLAEVPEARQPDDADVNGKQKVLQVVKSNYAIPPAPILFRRPLDAVIAWGGESAIGIEECFSGGSRGRETPDRDDAEELLATMLAGGSQRATDVLAAAKESGISNATLRRARRSLGVRVYKVGLRGAWYWKLPDRRDVEDVKDVKGAHLFPAGGDVSTFEKTGVPT